MKKEFFYRVLVIICCALLLSSFIPDFLYDCLKLYDVANSIDWLYYLLPFSLLGLLSSIIFWIISIIEAKEYKEISDIWLYKDQDVPVVTDDGSLLCYMRVFYNSAYNKWQSELIFDANDHSYGFLILEIDLSLKKVGKDKRVFIGESANISSTNSYKSGILFFDKFILGKDKLTLTATYRDISGTYLFGTRYEKRGFFKRMLSMWRFNRN